MNAVCNIHEIRHGSCSAEEILRHDKKRTDGYLTIAADRLIRFFAWIELQIALSWRCSSSVVQDAEFINASVFAAQSLSWRVMVVERRGV